MAGYREHISVSGMLGIGYGAGATFALGFSPTQGMLAGVLTWVAGMLPDLDAEGGKPIRELFSVIGAIGPLLFMRYMDIVGGDNERAMLIALLLYAGIRYGGAALLSRLSVHRGMFHSVPALIISAELTFLLYRHHDHKVRLLMAAGVAVGFLSHLVLDELYSVKWDGTRVKLKRSAGTALKFVGDRFVPNAITYAMLMFLTYAVLVKVDVLRGPGEERAPDYIQEAKNFDDAPVYQ